MHMSKPLSLHFPTALPLLSHILLLCSRLRHPIRHDRLHIQYSLDQVIHNLGPRLVSNLLDLLQLLLRVFLRVIFGLLVARCVLRSSCQSVGRGNGMDVDPHLLLIRLELLFLLTPVIFDLFLSLGAGVFYALGSVYVRRVKSNGGGGWVLSGIVHSRAGLRG